MSLNRLYAALLVCLLWLPAACRYEAVEESQDTPPSGDVPAPQEPTLPELAQCDGPCSCDEMVKPANDTGVLFKGLLPTGNASGCGNPDNPQDCDFGRDPQAVAGTLNKQGAGPAGFDFIKIAVNGSQLADDASQWACVLDAHTGLMWEVKQEVGAAGLRATDQTYSWSDDSQPDYTSPGLGECQQASCDTQALLQQTNDEGLCGYSDWRLPTKIELQDLVDYGEAQPSISPDYFPNVRADLYWTETLDTDDPGSVWSVNFNFGTVAGGSSAAPHFVILVRDSDNQASTGLEVTEAELEPDLRTRVAPLQRCSDVGRIVAPNSRFLRDAQGNVFDRVTGLIWKRCVEGLSGELCESGSPRLLTWEQAIAAGEEASVEDGLSGEGRWRLPNIKELQRTIETYCEEPPLNPFAFPNLPLEQVWSATPHVTQDGRGYQYQYQNSIVFYVARQQTQLVHLVRQCE